MIVVVVIVDDQFGVLQFIECDGVGVCQWIGVVGCEYVVVGEEWFEYEIVVVVGMQVYVEFGDVCVYL